MCGGETDWLGFHRDLVADGSLGLVDIWAGANAENREGSDVEPCDHSTVPYDRMATEAAFNGFAAARSNGVHSGTDSCP